MYVFSSDDFKQIEAIIDLALHEDIRSGDITTEAVYYDNEKASATFVAKQAGVVAGLEVVQMVAGAVNEEIELNWNVEDGDWVSPGQTIGTLKGPAGALLVAERTMLNFFQRMSGIATAVREFVDLVEHTEAHILDTRKTAPGHRVTDKWAVAIGGGENHRFGLYDRYLIKENHIRVAGSIEKALKMCISHREINELDDLEIEIEVTNLDELREALEYQDVDYIMLDNMSIADMKQAVEIADGRVMLEASGNVSKESIVKIAETGVDFISIGSITHSVTAMDISLLFD
jgi:nicotinate-nucleotide pyrophosphorylase (carboxylating)